LNRRIAVLDTTLRDGAQARGISFSVEDKLKILSALDDLGVSYVEAGNPGHNPKDLEFFKRAASVGLKNARLMAFGSTRRRGISVGEDKNALSLLEAGTEGVCIVGKSWDFHVTDIINAAPDENLAMIGETVGFFTRHGKEVIFEAEHFFDGYRDNPDYALATLKAAEDAGAGCLCLCDTNGGAFPDEISIIIKKITTSFATPVAIHCHNDCGMADANTVIAVCSGASQVQGTFNGFGERCGNARLSTVIPNLQLKKNYSCIPDEKMRNLTTTALLISEIANDGIGDGSPYVGKNAFAHKGGMHADGVEKDERSFEHVNPDAVGNKRQILTSEYSGRTSVLSKTRKLGLPLSKDSPETERIVNRLKELEHQGYQFEAADGSFALVILKQLGKYKPFFELKNYRVLGEQPYEDGKSASALIKIIVDGKTEVTAAEGDGPVNALDKALRKALEVFYPKLMEVHLTDYKVRVLDEKSATASKVRVLIESADGTESWTTVGVSRDIIEASWLALVDSIEYKLLKDGID